MNTVPSPTHIGIAARHINTASGFGAVTRGLLKGLSELKLPYRITAYLVEPTKHKYPGIEYRLVPSRFPNVGARFRNFLWDQLDLPRALGREKPDIMHWPYQAGALRRRTKTVITVCDVVPWEMKDYTIDRRLRYYARFDKMVIKRANHIVTISEHSKHDITRVLGIPPEKITTTFLGGPERTSSRFKSPVEGSYIFYIGGSQVRKNPVRLIKAFLRAKIDPSIKLVLGGSITNTVLDDDVTGTLARLDSAERGRIVLTGRISDEELAGLYQNALFFAYPSLYEGFGVPILEAMALDCPVLTSTTTSTPEVAGDAAVMVDPKDVAGMATAIERLVSDAGLRNRLKRAGRKRLATFSWKKTAAATVDAYEKLLA